VSRLVVRTLLGAVLALGTVALGAGSAVAGSTAAVAGTPAAGRPAGPVVVLGTAGLRWDDVVDLTPTLASLVEADAVAALAVRSVRDTTCPVDGWLALSAGRRAADAPPPAGPVPGARCREPRLEPGTTSGGAGRVAGWDTYRAQADAGSFDADPGLLGATLTAAGRTVAAVGPGAAIATADLAGRTARVWPGLPAGPLGTIAPGGDDVGLAAQVAQALGSGADLVVVDLGTVRDVPAPGPDNADVDAPVTRPEQIMALDTRLSLVLADLPADATVVLASLADDGTAATHLAVVAAHAPASGAGPALTSGLLHSSSTRQDGLVQSTDLLPTVLGRLGVPVPATADGSPLVGVPGGATADRLQHVTDLDTASQLLLGLVTPFFAIAGALEAAVLLVLGFAAHGARRAPATRHRALVLLRAAAVTIALVPAATFLANLWPWWRGPAPGAELAIAVVVAVLPLAGVALAGPWRRHPLGPAGVAGALTVAVLAADVLTGSRLSLVALIGGQPLVAGRFYGVSNPVFGILAVAAVLAALALADVLGRRGRSPRDQALAVAAVATVVTLVDGVPGLGSDVGGPPALVPAFGLLALRVAGVRVTWRRGGAIVLLTAGVLAAVSMLDWLRPAAERTHLGRFVQAVLDGGAGDVVLRKLGQNGAQLVSSLLTLLVPPAAVVLAAVLWRPDRWYAPALRTAYDREPLLRPGVGAIGVLLLLGFALNDSGVSIPPAALLVLAPALVAVTARAVDDEDAARRDAATAAARRPLKRR